MLAAEDDIADVDVNITAITNSNINHHLDHPVRDTLPGNYLKGVEIGTARGPFPTLVEIRHTSHVTSHTSHVTRHTSHVTRHTSHVTRHTSHVTPSTMAAS